MNESIKAHALAYAARCRDEQAELLRTLGRLPAPSRQEDLRAAFCRDWLQKQGAQDVTIDAAKNVICRLGPAECEDLVVFAAHTDVVFPDLDLLPVRDEDGRLYAPGIGDDTANLACMLMAAAEAARSGWIPEHGILFAATVGEEGLGNLKGSRQIFKDYGYAADQAVCFDLYREAVYCRAVGSARYEVRVRTPGGHSYEDFGRKNAIAEAARLITRLYENEGRGSGKATWNVGTIRGGTVINAIASEAVFTYEYRSEDSGCMDEMEQRFRKALDETQDGDVSAEATCIGIRPCARGVDGQRQKELADSCRRILRKYTEREIPDKAASTDANIPLSMGIPAVCIGTVAGAGLHTLEEYIESDSIRQGFKITGDVLRMCVGEQRKESPQD